MYQRVLYLRVRSFISTRNSGFHFKVVKRTERWSLPFSVEHKRTYPKFQCVLGELVGKEGSVSCVTITSCH